MSIATFTLIAALAGATAWVTSRWSGSRNLPTDAEVDRLVGLDNRRRAAGLVGHDDLVDGDRRTYAERLDAERVSPAITEEALEAASNDQTIAPLYSHGPMRAWLAGGYAMPTSAQVTAAGPYTMRGACLRTIPRHFAFADESSHVARLPNPTGLV